MTRVAAWLAASGLPVRWAGRERFVLLDTAFDATRFIGCWQAWRDACNGSALPACRLHVIAMMPTLPDAAGLRKQLGEAVDAPLARELLAAWPPATPDFHRLAFESGALQLLLVPGWLRERLPQLVAEVDFFWLDAEACSADTDPAWPQRLFKAAARLAAPGATLLLATGDVDQCAAAHAWRSGGFISDEAPPPAGFARARFAPAFAPRRPRAPPPRATEEKRAIVIGAGLAGCAVAWALSEQGWSSCVVDRHDAPAREASGNPAGLFHGTVNPQDGAHARFNRAAALEAGRAVNEAVAQHAVAGSAAGLLRLETTLPDAAAMQAVLHRLGLPASYVQALSPAAASALAGIALSRPCWHYPGGGWVVPAGLARAFLERGGHRVQFRGGVAVARLQRNGKRGGWQLLDAAGSVLDEASHVVLAIAGDAAALLGQPAPQPAVMQRVRGQLSIAPPAALAGVLPGLTLPRLPVAGAGYLLPAIDGTAVFGATAQADDDDAGVRAADHVLNLEALRRLTGLPLEAKNASSAELQGRTAWRCVTADRLPLIGAVVDESAASAETSALPDRLSRVPRLPGLFIFTALGSRGIGWAALGAQALAAMVTRAPLPLPAALCDAVDPARFALRRQRRPSASGAPVGD